MIDPQKLAAALGGDDGEIRAVTEWEDCTVTVVDGGAVYVNCALRKVITREAIDTALRENNPEKSEEDAARELLTIRSQLRR